MREAGEHGHDPHRFRDPGWRLDRFAGEILVRCPRCDERAVVTVHPAHRDCHPRPQSVVDQLTAPHRLACRGCGHTGTWSPRPARRNDPDIYFTTDGPLAVPHLTGPNDPFFGLPLWLRRPCCGGRILWAYNGPHLDLLEPYVAARMRQRHPSTGTGSTLELLPAWIKAAGNRDEVLATIRALRAHA